MITKGQVVTFRPEWSDEGDEHIRFVALEDEDGGRVKVMADIGLRFNPVQVVEVRMISCES